MTAFTLDELRTLELFEGLPESHLRWFGEHGTRLELAEGERMFEDRQADYMFVIVTGTIERFEKIGGQWLKVAVTKAGHVTGMLPYSRMTRYPGNAVAAEPSTVLRIHKSEFPAMLNMSEQVGQRLVASMSDRVRGDVRLEQQGEKMSALGRLAAGLAHELNNPAAAVRRAAMSLAERRERLPKLIGAMVRRELDDIGLTAIEQLRRHAETAPQETLTALQRSDREDNLLAWLEGHGVERAWEVAGEFTDTGVTIEHLDSLAAQVSTEVLPLAVMWVAEGIATDRMINEIASATARMSELVASIKTYSHMDRSQEHKPTDVREGLDNTITMMGHKIKANDITLERHYQRDLPTVPGNAGELNQVWTNLIDNAIDAMTDGGVLRLAAHAKDASVEVRIIDSGTGIPRDVRPHVFEPFFTTKDVGEGTGLGLDIAMRIVRTHQGQIDVDSRPGCTEMRVLLPRSPVAPVGDGDG